MTWAEFKAAVEAQGVQDSDEIEYIDVGGSETVEVDRAETGLFHVTDGW